MVKRRLKPNVNLYVCCEMICNLNCVIYFRTICFKYYEYMISLSNNLTEVEIVLFCLSNLIYWLR